MSMTIQNLQAWQNADHPSYFPTYSRKIWKPGSDDVANRFYRATIHETGEVVLWDIVDAIKMVLGEELTKEDLVARSKYSPEMLRPWAEKYSSGGRMGEYDKYILHEAYLKVRRMFKLSHLKPLKVEDVPFDGSKSAGLPTLRTKSEVVPQTMREVAYLRSHPEAAPPPLTVFHRGKNLDEVRGVQGYPFCMMLLEGRFFYPYQQKVIKHHTPYVGGRYDFETAALLNEVRVKSRFVLESDFSNFDGSISAKLAGMAFSIIHDSFDMEPQDEQDWSRITRYFVTAPMLMPDGYIYCGRKHGVPSGSTFTQLVDSIVNAIVLEYSARRLQFRPTRYFVLGDDGVLGLNQFVDLDNLAAVMAELGIKLNVKKSSLHTSAESIHFLGHDWRNGRGVRNRRESLIRLCTPERARDEYYSKNRDERRQAYIERIRSYQEDNPDIWTDLERLVQFYQMQEGERKDWVGRWKSRGKWLRPVYVVYFNGFYGTAQARKGHGVITIGAESNELSRWKLEKRQVIRGNYRGVSCFF